MKTNYIIKSTSFITSICLLCIALPAQAKIGHDFFELHQKLVSKVRLTHTATLQTVQEGYDAYCTFKKTAVSQGMTDKEFHTAFMGALQTAAIDNGNFLTTDDAIIVSSALNTMSSKYGCSQISSQTPTLVKLQSLPEVPSTPSSVQLDSEVVAVGIKIGAPLGNAVEIVRTPTQQKMGVLNPPNPISNFFETYLYDVVPSTKQVHTLAMIGRSHNNDRWGTSCQSDFKELKNILTQKYGQPINDFDFLKSGSIWKDSDEWVMSLRQQERHKSTYWKKGDITISLEAKALDSSTCYTKVGYQSSGLFKLSKTEESRVDINNF